ncbi:excalibur calcium-binding domain-containing protein [Roseobacter sp. HKCCA0434]|uniref:excalibur calcium-binding domain-containing protein n=1 Tax=Roseobacter sp. HKCCA0434 TaxID=3079297 RepID=UPI002905DA8D|nr:excalibur calcium-binding domain-containing protein [Roseobacter sp. HKCCA0434]
MRLLLTLLLTCTPVVAQNAPVTERIERLRVAQSYSCSPSKTCGQMRCCEEACFHLVVCGDTARDRDRDGIPCETLCGNLRCE